MYCPVCFQDTLKVKSNGVIKLAFNGKSRNNSLYTYNIQKETEEQLLEKFRDKVVDFFSFYADFKNKVPLKNFEAYSGDFMCINNCRINMNSTKLSVIGVIYRISDVKRVLQEEGDRFGISIEVSFS